jgi:hypothetical protein
LRPAGRPDHPEHADWPRRRWAATWVREVLVLRRGVLVPRTRVLAVRMLDAPLREAAPGEVRRLGPDPVVVLLRLDDDTLVEVAAPHDHRTVLVGPFLAAAVPGLPPGPREQPPRLRRPPAPPPRQERES